MMVKIVVRFCSTLAIVLFLSACGGGGGGGSAQPAVTTNTINLSALLTGDQETPAVATTSYGIGTVSVDPTTRRIGGVVVTNGIVGTQAHIHGGAAGQSGGVEIALVGGPTIWTVPDNTSLTADQFAKLNSGGLYFNVHSVANPGGEIRGQISQQVRFASLSGANETPAVTTNAGGVGVLALNPATGAVSGFVRTTGVTATAAHIHDGGAGVAGPVIIPLTQTSAGSDVWNVSAATTLTADQVTKFNSGGLYFNVHSAANPAGEIRGQILGGTLTVRNALLNGSQESPPILTDASGTGVAVANSVTGEVYGTIRSFGVTGTLAHIHQGAPGVAGGVLVPLTETVSASGIWVTPAGALLTPAQLSQFGAGNLYFNVHSAANPGGVIRGQINLVPSDNVFTLGGGTVVIVPATPEQPVVFPSSGLSFSTHIQQIFNGNCIACHAAGRVASFLPLTAGQAYVNLVGVPAFSPAAPGTRVVPGDSANSVLYRRVSGIGLSDQNLRMPLGGPFLNANTENAVKAWIDEGALNN